MFIEIDLTNGKTLLTREDFKNLKHRIDSFYAK